MVKIAVIQFEIKLGELEQNHSRAVSFVRQAAKDGAQLVVLPEYHLGDFNPDDKHFQTKCNRWMTYLDAYCVLARECNVCIVPGSFCEQRGGSDDNDGTPQRLVNAAYFIDHTGAVLGRYEKKNLWHPERPYVSAVSKHDAHRTFDTPLGRVGLLICWDLAFPEAYRELVAQGAKIIITPAFWKLTDAMDVGMRRNRLSEVVFIDAAVVSRAFENTCAVVFCNAAGPAEGGFMGRSQVAVPFMGAVGKFETAEEGVQIVDVDMDILEEAESVYKVREDIATQDWHYPYRKTVSQK